jgi:hypothetical protein
MEFERAQMPHIKSLGALGGRLIPPLWQRAVGAASFGRPPVSAIRAQGGFKLTRHVSPLRSAKVVESNSDVAGRSYTHKRSESIKAQSVGVNNLDGEAKGCPTMETKR